MNAPKENEVTARLVERVLADTGYVQDRLGYVPTEQQVREAAETVSETAWEAVARALDPYEEDVWTRLGVQT